MQENLFFLAEQVMFCLFIPLGLSLLIQTKLWLKLIRLVYGQNKQTFELISLIGGFIFLPLGLFLILTHNDWSLSPAVIVTLLGWLITAKCLLLLLCPQLAYKCRAFYGKDESFLKWSLRIKGALYIVLSGVVISNFWMF